MPELVEVRFKGNRKEYFTWDSGPDVPLGGAVLVEADRGLDLGTITAAGDVATRKCGIACAGCASGAAPEPKGRVVRRASAEDTHLADELRKAEEDVRRKVIERVRAHDLPMKVSDAEWQWDRKKLTIYFTAEQRVDFRELVRDLAALFRTRIELRQIGARDEAKRLDGVGRCGRQYCCSTWLTELRPVSLSLAKDQSLSLNPAQISGGCGRLLCCLRYEHEFYVASRRRFPKEGRTIQTSRGAERVLAIDIFRERVLLRAEDGTSRALTLPELRHETGEATEPSNTHPPREPAVSELAPGPDVTAGPPTAAPPESEQRSGPRRRRRRRRGGRRHPPRGPGPSSGDNPPGAESPGG
ncbi:MAG TPA: regulatory iron-sulfur-containing complex subunit RicT [Gemmatimonadales bacterium]|nr:regulatory iron-sulfur-containing complex subunit RicT [Gemmatimonadales bacterium]